MAAFTPIETMTPNLVFPKVPENSSDEHDFHVLGPKRFEHLVRALHEAQPNMYGSHLYGPDGQGQFGVDHVVYRRTAGGPEVEVGQSKAYRSFTQSQIVRAANDFLEHWEVHWKPMEVRRFFLFVGCAIKNEKAHAEIISQVRAFGALGVEFVVWDANNIYDRLAEARGVVRGHLNQQWYVRLFGEPIGPLTGLHRELESGNRNAFQIGGYVARLNQSEGNELAEWERRVRRGETSKVIEEVANALDDTPAAATGPKVRAAQLRFLASLLNQRKDLEKAQELLDEADGLDGNSHRQRAVLLLETVGAEALLAAYDNQPQFAEIRSVARLRMGDPAGAYLELDLTSDEPSVETLRLAALAKLQSGEREDALDFARRATACDPTSRSAAHALALCHFHMALSPGADPVVGEWPQPIDLPLVHASEDARTHLEAAEAGFAKLMVDETLDEHSTMVMWHFGTLACMPWRRGDTEARVVELQASAKFPIPLSVWCLSRGLQFDAIAAAADCDDRLLTHPNDLEALIVRVALATSAQDRELARGLLSEGREAMIAAGHAGIHRYWSAGLDMEATGSAPSDAKEAYPWLALRAAMDVRDRKKRLKRIASVLGKQLAQNGDPSVILIATQLLVEGNWYKEAVKALRFLLEKLCTAEAITVAVHALYLNLRAPEALDAMRNLNAFPNGALPVDLERVRTECLAVSGDLVGARNASLELARATLDGQDIWRSIGFHIATGAAPAALALYEEHQELLVKPSSGHVMLANALTQTHPEAAARITRRITADLPDALVTAAFTLASKLKLGDEQRVLIGRIQKLGQAGTGGVQLVDLDSIIEMMRMQRERAEKAYELYANGHAPVHFVAKRNLGIAYLAPLITPPQPSVRSGIFAARYGRRYDEKIWPASPAETKLLVDVTALMTAHALELLDTVERTFRPLMIAPDTVNAVLSMRSEVEDARPEQVAASKRLVALCDTGRIVAGSVSPQLDAFNVLWEVGGGEPASTLNFTRLAETMLALLPAEKAEKVRVALGNTLDDEASGAVPASGAVLNIDGTMAAALAEAGMLESVMTRFVVALSEEDIVRLRVDAADADIRAQVVDSLSGLAARLARGLDDGNYLTVPVSRSTEADPVTRSFMQLIDAMGDGTGILWTDDRYASTVDDPKFRTVTTVETLGVIRTHGRITRNREIAFRQTLRNARYQFLPLQSDEVATMMRAATRNGEVTDTPDLVTLRRHTGEFLHHRRRLQWPSPTEAEKEIRGEVPHLLDHGHALTAALVAIWHDESWSFADAEAASQWLVQNLELGLFPLPVLGPDDPRSDHLIGTHLGSLVLSALQIQASSGSSERQAAYLSWLLDTVIHNALRVRPGFREPMEEMIEQHLLRNAEGAIEGRLWLALAGRMVNAMPEPMRVSLLARKGLREGFGLAEHGIVSIGGHDFDAASFWTAAARAEEKPSPTLRSEEGVDAVLWLLKDGGYHLALEIGGREFRLDGWVWAVSQDDPEIRLDALRARAYRLDLGESSVVALDGSLAAMNATDRIFHVQERENGTAANWYADLEEGIGRRETFTVMDLMPDDLSGLAHFARLGDDIEHAASELLADRGLAIALRRFGTLPIIQPRALAAAVEAMDDEELSAFLDEAQADDWGPWTQLFLARMVIGRSNGAGGLIERLRTWIDGALSDDTRPLWRLYAGLARATAAQGLGQATWHGQTPQRRLATCWLHAGAISEIAAGGGVLTEQLIRMVNEARFVPPSLLLNTPDAFDMDTANPRHCNSSRLIAHIAAPVLAALSAYEGEREWVRAHLSSLVRGTGNLESARIAIAEGGLLTGNLLVSPLADDWSELFEGAEPGLGALFGRGLEALVTNVLAEDNSRTLPGSGWPFVRFAGGDAPLPDELGVVARRAARMPDLLDGHTDYNALLAFTQIASANGWDEFRTPIAAALEAATPSSLNEGIDPLILIETGLMHAMMEPDLLERTRIMGNHIRRLLPSAALAKTSEAGALQFARGLPGQYAEAFVDVVAEAWSTR